MIFLTLTLVSVSKLFKSITEIYRNFFLVLIRLYHNKKVIIK